MGTLAQADYGDILTTYRMLGWIGAVAAMSVVVVLVRRMFFSPRSFDVLRVVSAGFLLIVTATAVSLLLRISSLLVTVSETTDRSGKAVLLVLGCIAGTVVGWRVTRGTPLETSSKAEPNALASDDVGVDVDEVSEDDPAADPDSFEVPPLVTIPAMPDAVRWMLPFAATTAAFALLVIATGLPVADIGLVGGGSAKIETFFGIVVFVVVGLLAGLAALLPVWIREDEIPVRVGAAGLAAVALSVGVHGHIAHRISDSPVAALLVAFAACVLLPVVVDTLGELHEVLDRTATWIGTSVLLVALAIASASSLYGLQRGTPGVFFPDRERVNCPPTCPPDPLPFPSDFPTFSSDFPTLPSGFPTELLPSDFPYELFSPTPAG